MPGAAIIAARLLQFGGGLVLLGFPLFVLYGLDPRRSSTLRSLRPVLLSAALALGAGAVWSLWAQTAVMTGAPGGSVKPADVIDVAASTRFGMFTSARVVLAVAAAALLLFLKRGRGLWLALAATGVAIGASFVWTGHGAAGEGPAGPAHMVGDLLHLLAASVWLGALATLALLLTADTSAAADREALHRALAGFSGVGTAAVLTLVATGVVNSWVLVGPTHIASLATDPYGRLLSAKVVIFLVMLALAALNRFRLTPRLRLAIDTGEGAHKALCDLRRSVLLEALAGLVVLALVAALGTLPPPAD